jgi:hypothetical protein
MGAVMAEPHNRTLRPVALSKVLPLASATGEMRESNRRWLPVAHLSHRRDEREREERRWLKS